MEENAKNSNGLRKAIKAGVITLGVVIVLAIALEMAGSNNRPGTLSGTQTFDASPLPIGASERSTSISGSGSSGMPASKSMGAVPQNSVQLSNNSVDTAGTDKKVIKNGDLNLRVDSVDKAAQKVTTIAKANGGDVYSSNFYQSGTNNAKSGTITIKVPVANFEKTFEDIKKSAIVVIRESTSGVDVTMEYTDLQAQLKNSQAEEQSYLKLLDSAQKMDDILAITQQLSQVRGQIESLQGRIRYMDSQTDMATISATLTEDVNVTVVDSWRPWQVVKESVNALVKNVQGWVDFLIKLVILAIPVLLLYGLVVFIFYKIGKKIYSKFSKKDLNQ